MEKIFAIDGKLYNFLSKVGDLTLLNILWIICCIPVFTIGASTTALYYVLMKIEKGEDPYIFRSFFHSFKENFLQATIVWGIIVLVSAILYFDFYFSSHVQSGVAKLLVIPFILIAFFLLSTTCYVFPVMSFFKNSIKKTIINSFKMSIAHLPYTILIIIFALGPWGGIFLPSQNFMLAVFIDIVIGFSLFAWLSTHIFQKLFERYIPK
ncbi:MAG: YesL family protein [Clostridium sp.]|uniref:YesL family protein n=1 Tax=Clostridium sp. TaxID=1506 RepID=UPI00290F0E99|nr:YesL family protein [Clostridium sp.]MDU5109913.1 YesL family protein [Clostridium sp.]